jgi:predicted nucleic acid-binding protein
MKYEVEVRGSQVLFTIIDGSEESTYPLSAWDAQLLATALRDGARRVTWNPKDKKRITGEYDE